MRIMSIKAPIHKVIKPEFIQATVNVVNTINNVVTHTYAFIKYIFLKELEVNGDFKLSEFINKPFFMEVFLSLVDRQVRDGVKSGSGKSTLKNQTRCYRDLIKKYKESYCKHAGYVPPKLTHAQQSADYECTKLHTAYINNITAHFGNRLRQVLNLICEKEKKSKELQEKMKGARYTKEAIKEVIRNTVAIPCANIKTSVARKKLPEGNFLDEDQKSLVASILATYPQSYTFLKESIYYDVKANPLNHMMSFYKLGQMLKSLTIDKEKNTYKSFVVFPLRTSFIPAYVTVDTLIMNYHILGSKSFKEEKTVIWDKILNMKYKALKKQKADKSLCFQGMMLTDGVSVTVLKQNFASGRRRKMDVVVASEEPSSSKGRKNKRTKTVDDDDGFRYIEDLTAEELKETKDRCVLIDPGRRDILYCMKESSTISNRQVFRFTKSQRNKKSRRLRYLRNKLKPESIKLAERQLSQFPSKTLDSEQFVLYLKARRAVRVQLEGYYSNETSEEGFVYYPDPLDFVVEKTGDIYYGKRLLFITRLREARRGIANLDAYINYLALLLSTKHLTKRLTNQDTGNLRRIIEDTTAWLSTERSSEEVDTRQREVKQQAHKIVSKLLLLPFRKMKFASKIYYDKCDVSLAKGLKKKFGNDAVLVIGDWSAPNARFHEPTRNKGLLRFLKKSKFPVYLIQEYKTSTCCPSCITAEMETFKEVENPRPHQREDHPTVECHGLLR